MLTEVAAVRQTNNRTILRNSFSDNISVGASSLSCKILFKETFVFFIKI